MIRELRKIGGSTRLCLLLLLVVCCNAVLFALYATGDSAQYTMPQLRDAFQQEDLVGYEARLWQQLEHSLDSSTLSEYDALRHQLAATDAALDRVQQAEDYPVFRSGLAAEARLKLRMGLFDGFAARSLQRGTEVYDALADVVPQPVFLGGVELLSFRLTDALALLFPLVGGLTLLTHERAAGLLNLTRPTRYGRSRIYGRKLAAAALLSTAGFVLLYGTNLLLAGGLYGFSDLDVPVQSLYGFAACPHRLTVGQFLALAAGLKYLWLLCCTALVLLLCACAETAAAAAAFVVGCGAVAALLASSAHLWLRNLSLWQLAEGQDLFREAVYLNLFGQPADRVLCGVGFLFIATLSAGVGGAALYARMPGGKSRCMPLSRILPRPQHTRLAGHELYKALLSQRGLWVMLVFLAGILLLYSRVAPERSEFDVYYRNYSTILVGAPDREKDAYLAAEQTRFDELEQKLLELTFQYPDPMAFERESSVIRDQLRAKDAFQLAQSQYRQLRPGQIYLYQIGYQQLFGADAQRQNLLELGGTFLTLALLLSGSFAGERACGMATLLTASFCRRNVVCWKVTIAGLYALMLTLGLWLPPFLVTQRDYGSLNLAAQANSIQCLSTLSDGWTVGEVLLSLLLGRLLLLLAAATIVMHLSRRCTVVQTLLLSLLLLLLPIGAVYAWI